LPPTAQTVLVALLAAFLASPRAAPAIAAEPIVVASKIDTEGALLGNMIAGAARGPPPAGHPQDPARPTNIVRAALWLARSTSTPNTPAMARLLPREADPVWKDAARGYAEVKRRDQARTAWFG